MYYVLQNNFWYNAKYLIRFMSRWLKISLRITGILVCAVIVFWLAVTIYVQSHKKTILANITAQLNDGINGTLTIESMEPALIRGFPGISVELNKVMLRDSLWSQHRHTLLDAKNVYVAINVFSILQKNPTIKNIEISDGQIYMYTDTSGRSNTDLFRKDTVTTKQEAVGKRKRINHIYLHNVVFTNENQMKKKLIRLDITSFFGNIMYRGEVWEATAYLKSHVMDLIFNTRRGSFLKDKDLRADLDLTYNHEAHQLTIAKQNITIGKDKFNVGGNFNFGPEESFNLEVQARNILLKDAAALLTPNITSKVNNYQLTKPIDVQASIHGKLKRKGDPLIRASWKVKNNTLTVSGEKVSNCSFTGTFTNQLRASAGYGDANSAISFYDMKGVWLDIPFKADSIQIVDLKNPIFSGKFNADFRLAKLNPVFGGHTFVFNGGTAHLNLSYKAPYNKNANGQRYINGTIRVTDAEATYKPRGMTFKNLAATLNFKGPDLFIQNVKVQTGTTFLTMDGQMRNFANLYYTDPKKILLDWRIKSPQVNLNEFLVFLGKRKSNIYTENSTLASISRQLDLMLAQANMRMRIQVERMQYKRFEASRVNADITLRENGIAINNVSLLQGGGSLSISGNIDQSGSMNRFAIKSNINNINVQKLFYAFNNFGQSTINDRNLRGTFFGSTDVTGTMRDDGQIVPGSFQGLVQFDIRDGALINFEPLQKAGAFAFPNRDFTNITFSNLKNTFDIQGNKVIIRPMRIETSVLNVFMEGVYGFTTGTNIALQVPLRNPQKDALLPDYGETGRFTKGVIINLRAVDENGKVKFKLGKG
jgi:hypothetical protein